MRKKNLQFRLALLLLVGLLALVSGIGYAEKEAVTLKIFQYAPEMTEQMHDMANEYHRQFPNVTLEFTILQTDYIPVLRAKLNSGDMPDIFMSGGYRENINYQDYDYDLTKVPCMKKIEDAALPVVTMNGRLTGYPFILQAYSFIYNKKLFAEAGIKNSPHTLKEFTEVCQKLKSKGITPFGTGYAEWWVVEQTMTNLFEQYHGDYVKLTADLNSGKQKYSQVKENQDIFKWIDLTVQYGEEKPLETDFNAQCALIATNKVAMIHQGTWAEETIRKINPKANIGFLSISADGNPDHAGIMVDSNIVYRVCKQSKNLKEALKWLNWVITSDYGKRFVPEKVKQISTIKGAPFPQTQLAEETVKYMKAKKTYPWIMGYCWPDGFMTPAANSMQAYIAKTKTPQQVAQEWDQLWMKCVKATQ